MTFWLSFRLDVDLTDSLDVSLAWATAQSEIRKHRDASLEGNRVTGVPSHTTTAQLNWRPLTNWETSLTLRDIGDYAVNASNQLVDGGYRVTDLSLAYQFPGTPDYRAYLAVENLTDKVYASTVSTIGYATGAPRRVSLGLQASF